ncbi:hypothetical protein [Oceanicoccus sp. KOV_DT_Chl]|uniref:hypothetical protein n=1 Tax=Oceanicoccus sp. KOV_DT_Chl TaxID=1904639 RepID=UPI0011AF70C6|nr:hypothetical protein [Oceanicoccus sp. KOV_DT_Chl]
MKNNRRRRPIGSILTMLFFVISIQGCVVGKITDSAGNVIQDVDVVAISECSGAGCAANQAQVVVGSDVYTGYKATTNSNGHYVYDPYAEVAAPEDAMALYVPQENPDKTIKFAISKSGYQDILLHHAPQYESYTNNENGKKYIIATVPEMHLCRDDEIDSDGDTICDESEKLYGTSHGNADTDKDGVNDNVELFVTGTPPGDLQQCVFAYCQTDVLGCLGDPECSGWLSCMENCGEDSMLCPTECGAFYQSPVIDSLSSCALGNGCAFVEFPDLPLCQLPEAEHATVGNIDGIWWVSAIKGYDYVLYDDCQQFNFTALNATEIDVEGSHPITFEGETRIAINDGLFTRSPEGYLELVYENWAGYRERYNPYYVTPNVMVMHVCSVGTDDICHDYGTLILTRQSLSSMDSAELAALESALANIFQTNLLDDYTMIGTESCPNDATLP